MRYMQIFLLIILLHKALLIKMWDENEDEQKLHHSKNLLRLKSNAFSPKLPRVKELPKLSRTEKLPKLPRAEKVSKLPPCDEDQLMMYLAEIQAINPEDIINLATFEELNILCKKVSDSLIEMDDYINTCEPPQQKDLYMQLIKGVNALYEKLCTTGKFRTEFELHYQCYHELHNDLQDCNGPADWTEDEDQKVCKAYHDIADCYYTKTAKLCGTAAAKLMKQLMLAVINSVLTVHCSEVKKNPTVVEPMPEERLSNNVIFTI